MCAPRARLGRIAAGIVSREHLSKIDVRDCERIEFAVKQGLNFVEEVVNGAL
jgi:hypothetical protein